MFIPKIENNKVGINIKIRESQFLPIMSKIALKKPNTCPVPVVRENIEKIDS